MITDLPYTSYDIRGREARKTLRFSGISWGRGGRWIRGVRGKGETTPFFTGGFHKKTRTKICYHINGWTVIEQIHWKNEGRNKIKLCLFYVSLNVCNEVVPIVGQTRNLTAVGKNYEKDVSKEKQRKAEY